MNFGVHSRFHFEGGSAGGFPRGAVSAIATEKRKDRGALRQGGLGAELGSGEGGGGVGEVGGVGEGLAFGERDGEGGGEGIAGSGGVDGFDFQPGEPPGVDSG